MAVSVLSQPTVTTVILLDQSYSMSLPVGGSGSRLTLLLDALEERIVPGQSQDDFALIAFEDAGKFEVILPYPETSLAVLSAARDLIPWGTSPILAATRFAVNYAANLSPGAATEVILVTDGEDNSAYLGGTGFPDAPPPELAAGSARLTVLTIGGDRPGQSGILSSWVDGSGGDYVIVGDAGLPSAGSPGVGTLLDHGISSNSIGPETASQSPAVSSPPVTRFRRFLTAWLLVLKWNLAAAAALGTIAFGLALGRWLRRSSAVARHNALPTRVKLVVRTSLRRFTYTFAAYPITVGRSSACSLKLEYEETEHDQSFELRLAEDGLNFTSENKLNINGVPRRSWRLTEGDQVRVGKYRVYFEELITTTPLRSPPRTHRRVFSLPAFSLVAASLMFFYQPLTDNRLVPVGSEPEMLAEPANTLPIPNVDHAQPAALPAGPPLPALYKRGDTMEYFDADYLVIHTHPDDETLDFGTLLARLDAAGLRGVVVLLTDGRSGRDQYPRRVTGGSYPAHALTGDALVEVRVAEASRAMAHLGVDAYIRGGLPNAPYNSLADQLTVSQVLDRWGGLWAVVDALADVVIGYSPELVISPDEPRGPFEHFEHEATGVVVATLLDSLATSGRSTVRGHLIGIDPLQVAHYDNLVEISPWELNPDQGVSFRSVQLRALAEHKTQRDSSVVGIETRLAMPAEYYAVGFWNADFAPPEGIGIELAPGVLSEMAVPPAM